MYNIFATEIREGGGQKERKKERKKCISSQTRFVMSFSYEFHPMKISIRWNSTTLYRNKYFLHAHNAKTAPKQALISRKIDNHIRTTVLEQSVKSIHKPSVSGLVRLILTDFGTKFRKNGYILLYSRAEGYPSLIKCPADKLLSAIHRAREVSHFDRQLGTVISVRDFISSLMNY